MYVVIATFPCNVDHDSSRGFPSFGHTEAAVAYLSARRADPLRVGKSSKQVLPVTILQTRPTKLPSSAIAVFVVTYSLCINGLLPALVTGCSANSVVHFVSASLNSADETSLHPRLTIELNREVFISGFTSPTEARIKTMLNIRAKKKKKKKNFLTGHCQRHKQVSGEHNYAL